MTAKDYEKDAPVESTVRDPQRRRAVRRLLRAEVLYITWMAIFAVLALFAHIYAYFGWDLTASLWLQNHNAPWMFQFMRAVSFFGDGWIPWALAAVTMIIFLFFGRRSEAAAMLLSTGGGELLNGMLKLLIARPRPS